jgi:hypothetical protein
VVERPTDGTRPEVRLFAATDCEPLHADSRLVTGLELAHDGRVRIAAVMPAAAIRSSNARGWVTHPATPLPAGHVLVTLQGEFTADPAEIEAFVLRAYNYAMS